MQTTLHTTEFRTRRLPLDLLLSAETVQCRFPSFLAVNLSLGICWHKGAGWPHRLSVQLLIWDSGQDRGVLGSSPM